MPEKPCWEKSLSPLVSTSAPVQSCGVFFTRLFTLHKVDSTLLSGSPMLTRLAIQQYRCHGRHFSHCHYGGPITLFRLGWSPSLKHHIPWCQCWRASGQTLPATPLAEETRCRRKTLEQYISPGGRPLFLVLVLGS
jgi:hypothetical protein